MGQNRDREKETSTETPFGDNFLEFPEKESRERDGVQNAEA